ncbi:hypothetical protein [Pontibacter sp. H249]|uniref:hypothetical protein n=1 Tax=Pontibacter sp. H249 TaxID=3133420 RepID=UPI0030C38C67
MGLVSIITVETAAQDSLLVRSFESNKLPNIPFDNLWQKTNPVTVRHLSDHASGLGDLRLWHLFITSSTATTLALRNVTIAQASVWARKDFSI